MAKRGKNPAGGARADLKIKALSGRSAAEPGLGLGWRRGVAGSAPLGMQSSDNFPPATFDLLTLLPVPVSVTGRHMLDFRGQAWGKGRNAHQDEGQTPNLPFPSCMPLAMALRRSEPRFCIYNISGDNTWK